MDDRRKSPRQPSTRAWLGYALLTAVMAFLYLFQLEQTSFWNDEGETGLLARSILRHGLPIVPSDDSWHYPYAWGFCNPDGLWIVTPWLDEYIAAGSMALFGETKAAARLPFGLLALASGVGLLALARRVYRSDEIAIQTGILFVGAPAIMAYARQCRYYMVIVFGQVLLMAGLWLLARGRRRWGLAGMVGGLVLEFYTNYISVGINGLSLAATVLWRGTRSRGLLVGSVLVVALTSLFGLPWLLFVRTEMAGRPDQVVFYLSGATTHSLRYFGHVAEFLALYVLMFHLYIVPLPVLLIPLLGRWRPGVEPPEEPAAVLESFAIASIPLSILVLSVMPLVTERYLIALAPMTSLLTAAWLARYVPWGWARWGLVLLLALTSIPRTPWPADHWFRGTSLGQFHAAFSDQVRDPTEDFAKYFEEHAKPGETILIIGDDLPLAFETSLRPVCAQRRPLASEGPLPDWILAQRIGETSDEARLIVPEALRSAYEPRRAKVHIVDSLSVNRAPREREVLLFRRSAAASPEAASASSPSLGVGAPAYRLRAWDPEVGARIVPAERPDVCRVEIARLPSGQSEQLQLVRTGLLPDNLFGGGFKLAKGRTYEARFRARSDRPRTITCAVAIQREPWDNLGLYREVSLGEEWREYSFDFVAAADGVGAIVFALGAADVAVEILDAEIVSSEPWSVLVRSGADAELLTKTPERVRVRSEPGDDPFGVAIVHPVGAIQRRGGLAAVFRAGAAAEAAGACELASSPDGNNIADRAPFRLGPGDAPATVVFRPREDAASAYLRIGVGRAAGDIAVGGLRVFPTAFRLDVQAPASARIEFPDDSGRRAKVFLDRATPRTDSNVRLVHSGVELVNARRYAASFRARASRERTAFVYVAQEHPPYGNLGLGRSIQVKEEWSPHRLEFAAKEGDKDAALVFNLAAAEGWVEVDAVAVEEIPAASPSEENR